MRKAGYLVNLAALLVGFLGGSVLEVDLDGVVKKKGDFRFWIASDASRVYLCFRYLYIAAILWNYIQARLGSLYLSKHNYTLMMGNVGCLVYMAALLIGCLGGSVLKVDLSGLVNKIMSASSFGFQVMPVGSVFVSCVFTLQLSCGTIYKIA